MTSQNFEKLIKELNSLSQNDLRAILLTCDGRGKEVKEQALELLLEKAYSNGYNDGNELGYTEGYFVASS